VDVQESRRPCYVAAATQQIDAGYSKVAELSCAGLVPPAKRVLGNGILVRSKQRESLEHTCATYVAPAAIQSLNFEGTKQRLCTKLSM